MDSEANDSAEVTAESEQNELEGTKVSEALALPVHGSLGQLAVDTSQVPDTNSKPSNHRIKISASAVLFVCLILVLCGSLFYIGIGYLKVFRGDKAAAHTLANIKVNKFSEASAQAFETDNPNSSLNDAINKVASQDIIFSVGKETLKPSISDVKGWLNVNTNVTRNINLIVINKQAVSDYITKLAASKTHPAVNAAELVHPDGSVLTVSVGQEGETVNGVQAAINSVEQNLLGGGGLNVNLPATYTAFQTTTDSPFAKLIEVNLTSKQMFVYEKDTLVKQFPVSAGAPLTPTPVGTFHIYEKLVSQNMSGYNVNGTKYFQPNVPYVNYFDGADAIHGNYWRPAGWFGNINSSHGCVGLQVSDSEWVYNWAPIGTTVIVHY